MEPLSNPLHDRFVTSVQPPPHCPLTLNLMYPNSYYQQKDETKDDNPEQMVEVDLGYNRQQHPSHHLNSSYITTSPGDLSVMNFHSHNISQIGLNDVYPVGDIQENQENLN